MTKKKQFIKQYDKIRNATKHPEVKPQVGSQFGTKEYQEK